MILKGCRGVRAERPEPGQTRLINQAATLGFSANLDYKNTRCETLVSYLRGKEDLFNDLFVGGPGWFVYEEVIVTFRKAARRQLAAGELQESRDALSFGRGELDAVECEEQFSDDRAGALVAIQERVIARNAEGVARGDLG